MDIVETIMDAGFDPSIRDLMDHEEYESLIERSMDGNPAGWEPCCQDHLH